MTQNEENTPKLPVKPPLSLRLTRRLEETLDEGVSILPTGVMVEQMAILDIAFRQGLHYALSGSMDAPVFQAALKAQNQYRYTLKALDSFDNARRPRSKT
jgi:hypothetical protein